MHGLNLANYELNRTSNFKSRKLALSTYESRSIINPGLFFFFFALEEKSQSLPSLTKLGPYVRFVIFPDLSKSPAGRGVLRQGLSPAPPAPRKVHVVADLAHGAVPLPPLFGLGLHA